jgi:hypothetical protein
MEFNLSHSGNLALYAFTRGRAVGVDVELIREMPDADDLAERFFSVTETALLRALPLDRRSLAFPGKGVRRVHTVPARTARRGGVCRQRPLVRDQP